MLADALFVFVVCCVKVFYFVSFFMLLCCLCCVCCVLGCEFVSSLFRCCFGQLCLTVLVVLLPLPS